MIFNAQAIYTSHCPLWLSCIEYKMEDVMDFLHIRIGREWTLELSYLSTTLLAVYTSYSQLLILAQHKFNVHTQYFHIM